MSPHESHRPQASSTSLLTLGALGVVYGDIGTSPLYALKEVFHAGHVSATPDNVMGVLSLIFWTMMVIVSFKYVLLILRADNNGEGGLIAMLALATSAVKDKPALHRTLMGIGLFGTAIFYGDAVITPAMTVLSAVEGINVYAPAWSPAIVPLALLVLTLLFAVQRLGTSGIGRAFGPVMLLWFVAIALLGIPHIVRTPEVLAAVNPLYALRFVNEHRLVAFLALGAVVLVVTGGEALYADLGHFGKRPIRIAWFSVVAPALVLNYFGQGAIVLQEPEAIANPFYRLAPVWAEIPLVLLATAAAMIASQALITAAFSVSKQAIQLGILPRMRIVHTSVRDIGQIYLPFVNWGLFALIVLAVGLFENSTALAGAYGIAVTIDMTITTLMTFFVIRYGWRYPLTLALGATAVFFAIDLMFLSSNLLKLLAGGWFPLVIGFAMFTLMLTWVQGRALLQHKLREDALPLQEFLDSVFLSPPVRVEGTAVFLAAQGEITPVALLHNLKHNKVLHSHNLFVSVHNHEVPWIAPAERMRLSPLGNDCWSVELHFGFNDEPDVPDALQAVEGHAIPLPDMNTSYFLSRNSVLPTVGAGMAMWREKLFASMYRNAGDMADYLQLPSNRIVELGAKVEI